ncbi:deoxyribodipyrimidine photo-lyase [Dyella lipolytica]|uniref:Deoxyribodipyrimidine photo-lyase n=1 Tax=Dyella lipolytica TaxID=1867835 RepID=A0ABW8IXJ9_9GAMM|nr:deoxyribodipyrimidine photo-lyase [Dyella lipolytica]GLQ45965.1 deoxyribodipyrimidine photo-lyase [Dyella lipolytica]
MTIAIMLFRRDLRLTDNTALAAACKTNARVLPLYIHADHEEAPWNAGAASHWWLHHSLEALQRRLRGCGANLHLLQGDTLHVLRNVIERSGAAAVYWNRRYEPAAVTRDTQIKAALREQGVAVHTYSANLWSEPWQVETKQGEPYRVFTPYWRNLRPSITVTPPLLEPIGIKWVELPAGLTLAALKLLPRIRWDEGFGDTWRPGEAGAQDALELFCDDAIVDYAAGRDLPARHGTSRLSPHLHFGEISPRQIHHAIHRHTQRVDTRRRPDIEPYLRELGWREFAYHLLYHFPRTTTESFNPRFANFPWAPTNDAQLMRWQQGRTGIPLVDAGMRELWHTGWMHNRVRMIVASFLTKNLRQHWSHGARWFWDTLVDADLANNTLGWQWVAGCGADAAPYFRVFNPVSQARKFDPEGTYLRRWLPELADLPVDLLHEPWHEPSVLKRSGYPSPMVDVRASREEALSAFQSWRGA